MACHSLRHRGEELLGRRPRPRRPRRPVDVGDPAAAPVGQPARRLRLRLRRRDRRRSRPARPTSTSSEHGLPLHGLRSARRTAGTVAERADAARLVAGRELAGAAPSFPFDHRARGRRRALTERALTLTTTRDGDRRAPGADRLRLPPRTCSCPASRAPSGRSRCRSADRLLLDERLVPTGERDARAATSTARSATRTFDDGFTLDRTARPVRARRRRAPDRGRLRGAAIPTRRSSRRRSPTSSASSR